MYTPISCAFVRNKNMKKEASTLRRSAHGSQVFSAKQLLLCCFCCFASCSFLIWENVLVSSSIVFCRCVLISRLLLILLTFLLVRRGLPTRSHSVEYHFGGAVVRKSVEDRSFVTSPRSSTFCYFLCTRAFTKIISLPFHECEDV